MPTHARQKQLAQDHDEGVKADDGAVGLRETTDLGPIALGLFARRGLEANRQLGIDVTRLYWTG